MQVKRLTSILFQVRHPGPGRGAGVINNSLKILKELEDQFVQLYQQGRSADAAIIAKRAFKVAGETLGPDHVYTVTLLNNITYLNKNPRGRPEKAAHPARQRKTGTFSIKLVAALTILASVTFTGAFKIPVFDQKIEPVSASAFVAREADSIPYYRVKARLDPQEKLIEGEEEVTFTCPEPREEVVFNLYFNRYKDKRLDSSEIRRYAFKRGKERGAINIQWVSYHGNPVPFREEGETLRISLRNGPFPPGEHSMKIGFRVNIPYLADRSGGDAKGIWLGNWLPTLRVDGKQEQPTEVGDPFLNYSSTYAVDFTVPGDYKLVLSNVEKVMEKGNLRTYRGTIERVRDLPVFLNRSYKEASATEGNTEIHFYYFSSGQQAKTVLETAQKALAYFRNTVGEYPWKQLNIVENDMFLDGMEYSTLFLISTRALRKNPAGTVFHEVGHQWFYNIIGSDQFNAPFIDEGLVQFFTSLVLNGQTPVYHPDVSGLNKNLGEFNSWNQYRNVHYRNGEKLFENLYVTLGKKEFARAIREYYERYQFRIVSPDDFQRYFTEKTGNQSIFPEAFPGTLTPLFSGASRG